MTPREELELILTLIKKHSLPLSPILEYAIKEKMEQYVDTVKGIDDKSTNTSTQSVSFQSNKENMDTALVDVPTDSMKIVDYGDRSIAVIGETKTHKEPSMKRTPESRPMASAAIGFAALCAAAAPERIPLDIRPRK